MCDALMSSAAEWWLRCGDGVLSQPHLLFKEHLFAIMTGKGQQRRQNFKVRWKAFRGVMEAIKGLEDTSMI